MTVDTPVTAYSQAVGLFAAYLHTKLVDVPLLEQLESKKIINWACKPVWRHRSDDTDASSWGLFSEAESSGLEKSYNSTAATAQTSLGVS